MYSCIPAAKTQLCRISIEWNFDRNMTYIGIGTYTSSNKSLSSAHLLYITATMTGRFNPGYEIIRYQFDYYCSNDKCNDMQVFQRLLQSLRLTDEFYDIKDLLTTNNPFIGSTCLLFSNQTDNKICNISAPIDPNDCAACIAEYYYEQMTNKICARCYRHNQFIHNPILERRVEWNITDQTRSEMISITCLSNNCTSAKTGDKIRDKSTIEFDFDKFLVPSPSSAKMVMSSFHQFIFIIVVLCIKQFL